MASSAIDSASIEFSRHPLRCAQPEELRTMRTVDKSTVVARCTARSPLELPTPTERDAVVSEPAATEPAPAALRQITATRVARPSGEHVATSISKAGTAFVG